MHGETQLTLQNGQYWDITPAKVWRSNETSVHAIDQARDADANTGESRASETCLQLSGNVFAELSEEFIGIGIRPHGSLAKDPAIEIADPVNRVVNTDTDPDDIGFLGVDLQVGGRTAASGRGGFALINNGGPQQAANDDGYGAGSQSCCFDEIGPRDWLPVP